MKSADKSPDPCIFEAVLSGEWFSKTRDRRAYYANCHAAPLVREGYVSFERETKHPTWTEVHYKPTKAGMDWWIGKALEICEPGEPSEIAHYFEGKGIGCPVRLDYGWTRDAGPILRALQRGLVEFVEKPDHPWSPGFERSIVVALTQAGMAYFDSLPKPAYDYAC